MSTNSKKSTLTPLNFLILGLLDRTPSTGFKVCKTIQGMPIGSLSGSPGSVYPAITVLENKNLIEGIQFGGEIKPRKTYHATKKGKQALRRWLSKPILAGEAIKSPELVFIKLSFAGSDHELLLQLMEHLSDDFQRQVKELESFRNVAKGQMPVGPGLATEMALEMSKWFRQWTSEKVRVIRNSKD